MQRECRPQPLLNIVSGHIALKKRKGASVDLPVPSKRDRFITVKKQPADLPLSLGRYRDIEM
jgi:hypothetical protein